MCYLENHLFVAQFLIQSFMKSISADERRVVGKCLSGDFNFENDDAYNELLEILTLVQIKY